MNRPVRFFQLSLISAVLGSSLLWSTPARSDAVAPEAASGWTSKAPVTGQKMMLVTANPLATEAGMAVLRRGGSVIDAAIAAQAMLGLTEPQSSGVGGGAFLVHFDGGKVTTFDGRETAPAAAKPERFLDQTGKAMSFYDAVVGGRSVGVPGAIAALELAHKRYGKLPWNSLFDDAIRRAEEGFPISPRLYTLLKGENYLKLAEPARSYFYQADGSPKSQGSLLRNSEYAATLREIAKRGSAALYSGPIAEDMLKAISSHPSNPGDMTLADLQAYRAKERAPVCGSYRSFSICGMGAPSSGGIAVLQMLKLMERFPLASQQPLSVESGHLFAEAGRLAFADRGKYLGDPDFVPVPTAGLLDPAYLTQRSQLIDPTKSMGKANPGTPPGAVVALGKDNAIELPSTSHIVAVDKEGHALSMTTTIEDAFGSRIMVRGFLLNNQLTDFSFSPTDNGQPVANRVEPGKRPRSSMSPVLVFDSSGQLYAAAGSPGGSNIINYVAQTLVGLLDWKLDPQQAVSMPHYGNRNGATELEKDQKLEGLAEQLKAKGHEVKLIEMTSGLSAIVRTSKGWVGGADPRREGVVAAE
ncbi:gamma-glutamyltransferase [Leeia aquatica]|uniref:gamma-glutamyltransferase n=1 Tax=Leeia aquatica TaxID=2725557 RepID=UPI00197E29EB|nr:gamma-glutamyltransferase [Leeia aquatica]